MEKNKQEKEEPGKIELIQGQNRVLIIAPHGFRGDESRKLKADDENTGIVARKLAERFGFYAVINEKYKRTEIDFNRIDQLENVKDEFLVPIISYTDTIIKDYGKALVVWIHGIKDTHITNEVVAGNPNKIHAVIGMGQGNPDRPTALKKTVINLIRSLTSNGITSALAKRGSDYCGWHENIMNRLFIKKKYALSSVQSIQVEIRKEGFRDTNQNIENTADILSKALSNLIQGKKEEGETMQAKEKVELKSITSEVDIDTIKVDTKEDRKYIFRENLAGDNEYQRMLETEIDELAQSIETMLIHPLVLLQKEDGTYIILCGYRRYQALRKLERVKVRAEIYKEKDLTEEQCMEISLAENTKRRNLNPIEIGKYLSSIRDQLQAKGKRPSYNELASQYGKKLGIGESHMSVKQYLMLYELWRDDKSRELVNDIFKDKVQFGLAVALSFIEDPNDRNALYKNLVKPLALTRPDLIEIKKLLDKIAKDEFLSKKYGINYTSMLESEEFKTAIETASSAENKGSEFIRQVNLLLNDISAHKNKGFSDRVEKLLYSVFEKKIDPEDCSITPSPGMEKPEVTIQFKIKKEEMEETIDRIKKLLEKEQDIAEIIDYTVTTPKEIEDLI